jgi:hypothetical protein
MQAIPYADAAYDDRVSISSCQHATQDNTTVTLLQPNIGPNRRISVIRQQQQQQQLQQQHQSVSTNALL